MNAEQIRDYCLSLSPQVAERFPFTRFKAAQNVLAFYIGGHMFCYFDIDDLRCVTVKCNPDDVASLLDRYDCIAPPYNGNPKYWIGIDATRAETSLMEHLIAASFVIVSKKK